jgi:hypothetical protein
MLRKGIRRIGILAPYKYGKTPNILAIALHRLCLNPNLRCKIVCNDDFNAKKRVSTLKSYIEYDQDFKHLFGKTIYPDKDHMWTAHALTIKRSSYSTDGSVEAAGALTTGMGGTHDIMIFDDVCDLNNSVLSPARRNSLHLAVNDLWLSRLEPEGIALYIATTWHQEDITHDLLDRPNWAWLLIRVKTDLSGLEYCWFINK